MAIYVPGRRDRKNKKFLRKRSIVATLQLTAMVDMFTVLVVFLLQNYASTNQILPISEQVKLPKATATASLVPSGVVVLSRSGLMFDGKLLLSFQDVKKQSKWLIEPLRQAIAQDIVQKKINEKVKDTDKLKTPLNPTSRIYGFERATLQADEDIDLLTIKKVMYTLTYAGIKEINFAVIQIKDYS